MNFNIDIDETYGIIEVSINGDKHICTSDDEVYMVLKEWAFDIAECLADITPTARLQRWAGEGYDG